MTAETATSERPSPEGIDLGALARYLPPLLPEAEGPLEAELISGGKSNLTYLLRAAGGEFVLRRPPLGHVLPTAHDMSREFKVISALGQTDVPVPAARLLCDDPSIIGAPFYVMDRVHGVIVQDGLPDGYAPSADDHRRMSEVYVETLAALHAVDYAEVGLADFGRPEGYLARQVRRWGEQWERSKTRELPEIDELKRRLEAALPPSPPPTIVHGDYRLGNVMFAPRDPGRLAAVLDWEMSTLGDPLTDVGYMMMYWVEEGDGDDRREAFNGGTVSAAPGFYRRAELAALYAERSGRAAADVEFYLVFAFYKLAIIVEGIQARFLAGQTYGEGFEDNDRRVRIMAQLGIETAAQAHSAKLRGK
jgi:aminoglycoside phosphotransferase (APT) family kinase protein